MKNTLVAEVRPDKDGKLVTRHVRADKAPSGAARGIPSPALPASSKSKSRRAFKPNDTQLQRNHYGIGVNSPDPANWGPHVIGSPHPELEAVPFTDRQKERYLGNYYRFQASEVEYYSVMSVVRPFYAINLLHRGITSAEEALEFLNEHGIDHLAGDYGAYTDELLRQRIGANFGMVYLNDCIDSQADPVLAGDWVKMCSQKSILDKAIVIKDEMLSGAVTIDDLKAVGVKNLAPDIKTVAEYIIHSKDDNNPNFTFQDISKVMSSEVDNIAYEKSKKHTWSMGEVNYAKDIPARLAVTRFHGPSAGTSYNLSFPMHDRQRKLMEAAGTVDEKRLADLTLYATTQAFTPYTDEDLDLLVELHDAGVSKGDLDAFIKNSDAKVSLTVKLVAAKEGIHSAVSGGWL